jgi:hypothetical protein
MLMGTFTSFEQLFGREEGSPAQWVKLLENPDIFFIASKRAQDRRGGRLKPSDQRHYFAAQGHEVELESTSSARGTLPSILRPSVSFLRML